MLVDHCGPLICRASVTRAEVAAGVVMGNPYVEAESRMRIRVETERVFVEGLTGGRVVTAIVSDVRHDMVTTSQKLSVSAMVEFRVEGLGWWRPDATKVVGFVEDNEEDEP